MDEYEKYIANTISPEEHHWQQRRQGYEYRRMMKQLQQSIRPLGSSFGLSDEDFRRVANVKTPNPKGTLALIKKSIKQIKAEAVNEKAQDKIKSKIHRLKDLGVTAQAVALEAELQVRIKLMRLQEWSYKVLPHKAIEEYDGKTINSYTVKVHIEPLETYCGTDGQKDKTIPNVVLNDLEKAKGRQVFDEFKVLWVEKIKDPLLLGAINGCEDYFLIAEWGEDISFKQLMKGHKQR